MKAIAFTQHGTLDNVAYMDVAEPSAASGEVLVEIRAAALNRLDLWVLAGWTGLTLKMPHVLGSDGAGIVVETGPGVSGISVGDHVVINPTHSCGVCRQCLVGRDNMCNQFAVFGEHLPGFYCRYRNVPVRNIVKMPPGLAFTEAAAASLVYVTAWHSLITRGQLRAGEDILIIGAGGGVNTASIQIAQLAGARHIIVVGSTDEKLARARELGANILINRHSQDWGNAVYMSTGRRGVDVVVNNVGGSTYHTALRSLKRGGRLLTVGNTGGPKVTLDNRLIFGKHLSIIGSTMGPINDYEQVMQLLFDGKLKPIIDTIYPLSETVTALHRLQAGSVAGKLVVEP